MLRALPELEEYFEVNSKCVNFKMYPEVSPDKLSEHQISIPGASQRACTRGLHNEAAPAKDWHAD